MIRATVARAKLRKRIFCPGARASFAISVAAFTSAIVVFPEPGPPSTSRWLLVPRSALRCSHNLRSGTRWLLGCRSATGRWWLGNDFDRGEHVFYSCRHFGERAYAKEIGSAGASLR